MSESKKFGRALRVTLVVLAVLGSVVFGGYQRRTGPSYPVPVDETLGTAQVGGQLPRSHPGEGGAPIRLSVPAQEVEGEVVWRRFPTSDAWNKIPMKRQGEDLVAELPHQPSAGKLEYSVRLAAGSDEAVVPESGAAVIRYRDEVPAWVLIPHILAMFIGLAVVLRAAAGALIGEANLTRFSKWVLLILVPGGLVLGPLVQKYAFGAYWTGWPFGGDWTDNKTAIVILAWVVALIVARWRPPLERSLILIAAVVTFVVYLIPHSVRGSELNWEDLEEDVGVVESSAPPG